jgi:membrane protein
MPPSNPIAAPNERRTTGGSWFHRMAGLLRQASDAWLADNVPRLSASVAFYTVLSLIPFLIVIMAIAAHVFGERSVQGQLIRDIKDLAGNASAEAIQSLIASAYKSSAAVTVFGALTLAYSASAVVMEMRDSLNVIWNVRAAETLSGFASFLRLVKERFYLFGLILGVGALLLASLALSALVAAISAGYGPLSPVARAVLHVTVFATSFAVVTLTFAAIYKVVPEVRLDWSDVMVGACFTSFLFSAGKVIIGFYLARVSYNSTYGAAGSILIILVWVYYSAQLFFFGAEFTKVYAKSERPAETAARKSPAAGSPKPAAASGSD